jgi:Mg2+ and Co2+ transporter CorA
LDFSLVKTKLHIALEKLLIKLKELLAPIINEFNLKSNGRRHDEINALLNDFQRQISGVFDRTKEQLNRTRDDLIESILSYWNNLKNRFFG